ncbi:beta galactosidase 1 [Striga asiatica]|uniref:Beta galactosidase 1 n=1 Tax=Striga asiatica TaxID=4170 RepID=A0A5A7PJ38_STRAF|nr:beta galactosidase 1 [Striga asiatica]
MSLLRVREYSILCKSVRLLSGGTSPLAFSSGSGRPGQIVILGWASTSLSVFKWISSVAVAMAGGSWRELSCRRRVGLGSVLFSGTGVKQTLPALPEVVVPGAGIEVCVLN